MALWLSKEENITSKVSSNMWIKKSGVYDSKIINAEIIHSNSTQAKGLSIKFETESGLCRPTFWFQKGDGTQNDYATKILDRLIFLCKLKIEQLIIKADGSNGTIPALEGKEIGIFLTVTTTEYGGKEQLNYNTTDFYDIKTKKTSEELKNKEDALNYEWFSNKYKDAVSIEPKKEKQDVNEDEFPF